MTASRSEETAKMVSKAILSHRLVPGTKLGERTMSEVLGVSRIVVRQAIIRLADEGLVAIERNRGAFVAKPTFQEALESIDALVVLEQGIAASLIDRPPAEGLSSLRDNAVEYGCAMGGEDKTRTREIGTGFHALLVGLTHNRVVAELHAKLMRRTQLVSNLYPGHVNVEELHEEHVKMIELIERKRHSQLMRVIYEHHYRFMRGFSTGEPVLHQMPLDEAMAPFLAEDGAAGV